MVLSAHIDCIYLHLFVSERKHLSFPVFNYFCDASFTCLFSLFTHLLVICKNSLYVIENHLYLVSVFLTLLMKCFAIQKF